MQEPGTPGKGSFTEKLGVHLAAMGMAVEQEALQEMEIFWRFLLEENRIHNLTAIVDDDEALVKHFLDSLTPLCLRTFPEAGQLVDVGSGAGFPGIPLALANRRLQVTLVESVKKKADFLRRASAKLALNARVLPQRAEEAAHHQELRESFDAAVARALAPLPVACEWCLPFVRVGGVFVAMRGARGWEDLADASRAIERLGAVAEEVLPLELPGGAGRRVLISMRKERSTPPEFPRPGGAAKRKPL